MEFNGRITGKAERFFWSSSRKQAAKILLFALSIMFLLLFYICIKTQYWKLLIGYASFCFVIFLTFFIPKSTKERDLWANRKIFIEEEYIVCTIGENEEVRLIKDAIKLMDYGDFYYICFPLGKKSDNYICQKSLLTKGTLEEFEALFEGKIERVNPKDK